MRMKQMRIVIVILISIIFCVFSGCSKEESDIVSDICDEYGLNIVEKEIFIEGLEGEYQFLFLADTHALIKTFEYIDDWGLTVDSRIEAFSNSKNVSSKEQFEKWIDIANAERVDALLLGGDILDYYTPENHEWLLSELGRLKTPYIYALGNHEICEPYDKIDKSKNATDVFDEKHNECSYIDYGEFVVCSINSGQNRISPEALQLFTQIYNMQKPIILISHIPLCSENTPLLKADTERIRGENRLIDPDLSVEMDSSTKEFYNLIVSENSPVVAVLCGHNHF